MLTPQIWNKIAFALVFVFGGNWICPVTVLADDTSRPGYQASETRDEREKPETSGKERQKQLIRTMDQIFMVLNTIISMEGISDHEKQDRIFDFLRTFRFGENNQGYVKAITLDGVIKVEPNVIEMEGKDLHDFEDPNVFLVFEDFLRICFEKGQDWSSYVWPRFGDKEKHLPTVSLVRFFESLDCAIILVYHPITIPVDDFGGKPYIDDHQVASPI